MIASLNETGEYMESLVGSWNADNYSYCFRVANARG